MINQKQINAPIANATNQPFETPKMSLSDMLILFTAVGVAVLAAMFIVPDWLTGVSFTWTGEKPRIYWYLGRSSAFVSFIWLWLSMLMGLMMTNRLARVWPGGPTAFGIHQFASILGLAFAIFHAFVLMGSRFLHYDVLDVLIPFHSDAYRPEYVALGQLALYGILILTISFYLHPKLISRKVWRAIHFASFATFTSAAIHGMQTGSDIDMAWVQGLYTVCVLSITMLSAYRVIQYFWRRFVPETPPQRTAKTSRPATMRFEQNAPPGVTFVKAPTPSSKPTPVVRKSSPPPNAASTPVSAPQPPSQRSAQEKKAQSDIAIVYGSQSGKTESLARQVLRYLTEDGIQAKLFDGAAFNLEALQQTKRLILMTSTYGAGAPPDNIARLYTQLKTASADCARHLEFCVFAVGDRQYPSYCQAGKDFDERLITLSARRMLDIVTCEADDQDAFDVWLNDIASYLAAQNAEAPVSKPTKRQESVAIAKAKAAQPVAALAEPTVTNTPITSSAVVPAAIEHTQAVLPLSIEDTRPFFMALPSSTLHRIWRNSGAKKRHFQAHVLRNVDLCGAKGPEADNDRQVRQIVFSLLGSGMTYEPGDALAVQPVNSAEVIDELLRTLRMARDFVVPLPDGSEASLGEALTHHYDITRLTEAHLKLVAYRTGDAALKRLLQPEREQSLADLIYGRQLIDLLSLYPNIFHNPQDFVAALGKLQPRLYSISSSRKLYPDQAHLTVGVLRYNSYGRIRRGVCSSDLAQVGLHESRAVHVHTQRHFRLPTDSNTPIIMIGAGTGIAPFRAFLQERMVTGATGKNWLIFGCRNSGSDFIYQDELQQFQVRGLLNRFNVAFSRGQPEKVYVQDLIQQKAAKLWHWLELGAHLYVCGDAKQMAKGVESALLDMAMNAGGHSSESANAWLDTLQQAGRYQRDIYGY